jgi:mono/diheme cytochrome c family protein
MNIIYRFISQTRIHMVPGRSRLAILPVSLFILLVSAGFALAQTPSAPESPPDATAGRDAFNDNCASCHGQLAMGDGRAVSQLSGNIPTAMADPDYLRTAVPAEMFSVITEGRIDKLMPPFGSGTENVDPLPTAQRWDIIGYIYSLGTPSDSIDIGQAIYEENCLDCHGEQGQGDGPAAGDLETEPADFSDLGYWSQASNQDVFDVLVDGPPVQGHEDIGLDSINEEEIWSVVDYLRTFSYQFLDAHAPFRPLEEATVIGNIVNGTTGESFFEENAVAELRAYNQGLQETLVLTTPIDIEGGFLFELTDVPQDQFYRVSVFYNGVEFGSDFGGLTPTDPELELPITVFETSTDPTTLSIERLHQILSFFEGGVSVNELYVVNNNSETVYIGESGNADEGTFEMVLPGDAQEISFQRAFGSLDEFIPANELVFTGRGWADTFPLRPGPSSVILLASYVLPYEDGVTISHPILYSTSAVNLVVPDAGVALTDEEEWVDMGQRSMGSINVSNFGKSDLPAGSVLTVNLEGEPDLEPVSPGTITLDNQSELLIGLAVALLVIGVAAVFIWKWKQEPVDAGLTESYSREDLLQAIADLDDDFELGRISEDRYHSEREDLKSELVALWEEEQGS